MSSKYWSLYWQQGHLTSFGDDKNNYQGVLANYWQSLFAQYDTQPSTIVDVGTGNGALIELAIASGNHKHLQFIGVDYAALNIPASLNVDRVQFLQKTSVEAMPLEDNSVDVVISQFGIEYSHIDKAIAEVARIVKPGGHLHCIVHDARSIIVKPNTAILTAACHVSETDGPLNALRQLINTLNKFGPQSAQAEQARNALNQRIQVMMNTCAAGVHGTNFPAFLKAVMNPSLKFKDRKHMLKLFESEMKGQIERLTELTQAAVDEADKQHWLSALKVSGFSVEKNKPVVETDSKLIGWLIQAKYDG